MHSHLGMRGRWHRYRRGEAWERPRHQASLLLEADGLVYVCFHAARAEVLRRIDVPLHPALSRLGPDLLAPDFPVGQVLRRARTREPRTVGELLLDQRVACGIGNVYKSEVLFLEGIHPDTRPDALPDAVIAWLYRRARELMSWNLGGWRRTTLRRMQPGQAQRPWDPRLWVYGRAGEACWRCRRAVRGALQGDAARSTYWCPGCQPAPPRAAARARPNLNP